MVEKSIKMGIVLCLVSGICGCSGLSMSRNRDFTEEGLPHKKFLIGGGFEIKYTPNMQGIAYWVDETTKKILSTVTVKPDEEVVFGEHNNTFDASYGIRLEDAKLSLYFIPKTKIP